MRLLSPRAGARLRVVCLPHAGAGASMFRHWSKALPASVDVCAVSLPGREGRYSEPPYTRMEALVADLVEELTPHLDIPCALFGHSLGALTAFEIAHALPVPPAILFVSACAAPHLPYADVVRHRMSDEELRHELVSFEGTPPGVLSCPDLLDLVLPTLRADFTVSETYAYPSRRPLDCPISAFYGHDDASVPQAAIDAWRRETTGPFTAQGTPGGHFSVITERAAVLSIIAQELRVHGY